MNFNLAAQIGFGYGFYNSEYMLYTVLLLAVFVIGLIAQSSVKRTFNKYSQHQASSQMSASRVAQELLWKGGSSASITMVNGSLTDHFNPRSNVVGLSETVYGSSSIAALAVAAHEIGHVMQYEDGYLPIKIRNTILPVAQIGSSLAPYLVIFGVIFGFSTLAVVGVYLFAAVFAFQLVTLPVELNASSRAINMLESHGYISNYERPMAKKVLRAAAMTYIIATLASLLSLLRLISIANRNRR